MSLSMEQDKTSEQEGNEKEEINLLTSVLLPVIGETKKLKRDITLATFNSYLHFASGIVCDTNKVVPYFYRLLK